MIKSAMPMKIIAIVVALETIAYMCRYYVQLTKWGSERYIFGIQIPEVGIPNLMKKKPMEISTRRII